MSSADPPAGPSNWVLIRRLLGLAWRYCWGCIRLLIYQAIVLALAIVALRLVGFGIDLIRFHAGDLKTPPFTPWGEALPTSWSPLTQVGAVAVAVLVTELLRAALNSHYIRSAGRMVHGGIVVDLRSLVYEKLQRLSFRFFDANATGSIINRVTSDVQSVRA